jgi:hypothetical protein
MGDEPLIQRGGPPSIHQKSSEIITHGPKEFFCFIFPINLTSRRDSGATGNLFLA